MYMRYESGAAAYGRPRRGNENEKRAEMANAAEIDG
jgi:hypothetical protein